MLDRYGALYKKAADLLQGGRSTGSTSQQHATSAEALLERHAELYKQIGDVLQRELPAGWTKTWAYAEMSERDGSVVVHYVDDARKIGWIEPPLTLYERFRQLNNASRIADPTQVWTTLTFALQRSGKFDVDYGYEAIPIDDEQVRLDAWKTRYLPDPT